MSDLTVLLRDAGITYRQFDYWCVRGLIPDLQDDQNPGQGYPRELTPGQRSHLRIMAELVNGGFRPDAASTLAVTIRATGTARIGAFAIVPAHRLEAAS